MKCLHGKPCAHTKRILLVLQLKPQLLLLRGRKLLIRKSLSHFEIYKATKSSLRKARQTRQNARGQRFTESQLQSTLLRMLRSFKSLLLLNLGRCAAHSETRMPSWILVRTFRKAIKSKKFVKSKKELSTKSVYSFAVQLLRMRARRVFLRILPTTHEAK